MILIIAKSANPDTGNVGEQFANQIVKSVTEFLMVVEMAIAANGARSADAATTSPIASLMVTAALKPNTSTAREPLAALTELLKQVLRLNSHPTHLRRLLELRGFKTRQTQFIFP